MPPSNYLAVDPGVTTGWAEMVEGRPIKMGEVPYHEIWEWVDSRSDIGLWIVEAYIIRPANIEHGYAHQWNKGEALQVIGAIKLLAFQRQAVVVEQQPSIKPAASRMSGIPYTPGKSGTHMFDAALHGAYYWIKKEGPYAEDETAVGGKDSDGGGIQRPARVTQISSYSGLRRAGNKRGVDMPK